MQRPQDDLVPLHEPFETALRGFNRQQVLAHIESLEGQISMITADRASALAQVAELCKAIDHLREGSELLAHLRRETQQANERVELMHQAPMIAASSRIQHIVRLAEEEAAELRAQAKKETDELRTQAEKAADEVLAHAQQEAGAQRQRATGEAEAMLRTMTQRCAQLEVESERKRKAAEQQSAQEIARSESEARERINTQDRRSIARVLLLLGLVGPQLAQRVAEVERQEAALAESLARAGQEVSALETFRENITAQLSTTRQMLVEALEQVQQTTIEDAVPTHPVPIQRDTRPVTGRSVQGGPVQLVRPGGDELRRPS